MWKKWKSLAANTPPIVPPVPVSDDVVQSAGDVKRKPSVSFKSDQPVSTLRLSSRCVLLTYFDGDITSCIDEHFSRALRQSTATATTSIGDDRRFRHGSAQRLYGTDVGLGGKSIRTRRSLPPVGVLF
jgi:hypothetical protein